MKNIFAVLKPKGPTSHDLERTRVGEFSKENAVTLDEIPQMPLAAIYI